MAALVLLVLLFSLVQIAVIVLLAPLDGIVAVRVAAEILMRHNSDNEKTRNSSG